MRLCGPFNSGAAAGNAGSATANTDYKTSIPGFVMGCYIKYNHTPPATTDITVVTKSDQSTDPSLTLLVATDQATSKWFFPQAAAVDQAGAANGLYIPMPLLQNINVKIDGADAADNVDIWLLVSLDE
jgi:hypothetical protein